MQNTKLSPIASLIQLRVNDWTTAAVFEVSREQAFGGEERTPGSNSWDAK